ncbi:MAG TPA: DUF3800 domain-containing protein [Solirubrobacteraceae bacterium]|nr:DUF3800 domain-containing protein [Solirubrobacteraceae bacterium]
MDPDYPLALFGAVVDRHYSDYRKRAYEEILHRFDEMLGPTATRQEHWRGVVVHDESNIEKNVQAWTQRWREVAGRIPGKLGHVVDVPFFADSKASRMIQAADLVTFALWRYYGLRQPDKTWIDYLWTALTPSVAWTAWSTSVRRFAPATVAAHHAERESLQRPSSKRRQTATTPSS